MDQLMALPKESDMANRQLLEHLRHQDVEQNLDVNLEHLRHQDVLQNQDALHLGDCLPLAGVLPDVVDVVLVDEELLHRSAR
jgi:muramoyltetrapeptide carboxypeptidase LdcA involved in peptidoglycan recycling